MNISQTFIERPIATSLLMAAIALFGGVAYRSLAGQRPAQRRFPHAAGHRQPSRRQPGDHGRRRRHAARKPVLHHRRPEFDDLVEFARQHPDHPRIRPQPQARRRRRGRAGRHHPGRPPAAPGHADAAHLHQGESGRPADPLSRPHLAHPAALDPRRVRRDAHRAAHLHDHAAWPRCRCWARRNTPSTCRWTRMRWPRGRSASTKSKPRSRTGTSICPPAPSSARSAPSPCRPAASC